MLESETEFYTSHHDEIVAGHIGEFVALEGAKVIGYFKNLEEAGIAMKGRVLGTFALKRCRNSEDEAVMIYEWERTLSA